MCCVWMNVAFERSMERKKECVYVCVWKKEGERERDKFMLWYAGSEYNYILYILNDIYSFMKDIVEYI